MAGNIKGITIELNGDTTKLDKALRNVNKETKDVQKQLQEVERALKMDPGNTELVAQKERLLGQEIDKTKQKLEMLRQADEKVSKEMEEGIEGASDKHDELQRQIATTESKEKMLQKEFDKLREVPSKVDQIAESMAKTGEKVKEVGDQLKSMGKTYSMYVTAPLVAAGTVGAKKFADVDKIMQLTNATMGNTAKQAELLDKAMKDAASNSTFGMGEAAEATLNFARAGLTAEQAAAALAPAMNLAAGEGGELDTVSAGLVATINGFAGSFEEAADYADVFANACNNSALDVNSLSEAMSVAAPIFHAAGYDVRDAALYMGTMANAGIDAGTAANALKTGMAKLVSPAKQGKDWLDKLGVSITNADGSMKDSVTVQRELHDAFAGLSESEQIAAASAIFGKNQMSNWLALINTAPADVEALAESIGKEGTTAEMAEAMMSGFGGSLEKLKSSIDVAATSLGEALAPIILAVANGIQKLVDWFNNLSPAGQRVVAVIGIIVAAIGPLLLIIGTLMSAIGSIMMFAPIIAGAIGAIAPVILIVVGVIAALVAIGIVLYKNWDTIKEKAAALKEAVVAAWQKLKDGVVTVVQTVRSVVSSIWQAIRNRVLQLVQSLVSGVVTRFQNLKANASRIWNAVKNAITHPIETAKNTVAKILNRLRSYFPLKIGRLISGLKLPHFSISGKFSLNPPSVPHFSVAWYKTGGIFNKPTLMPGIGEAGPEAVVPLDQFWAKLDAMSESLRISSENNTALMALLMQYLPYLPELANMQLVTDTGALVGQLAPQMDDRLGVLAQRQRRQ